MTVDIGNHIAHASGIAVDSTALENVTADNVQGAITQLDALGGGGGGGAGGGLPAAQADFTTETLTPDPATGSGSITVVVVPADQTAFAIKLEGDDFPRWLFLSDATDGLYLGDGTVDPYSSGVSLSMDADYAGAPAIALDRLRARNDIVFSNAGKGPVLQDPNGDFHRIKVATNGTLSTEPVA